MYEKEQVWSKYENVLLMIIMRIRVKRSKYGASMKMYGSEGLYVIEDGWIGQGIKKEKGVLCPTLEIKLFPTDL